MNTMITSFDSLTTAQLTTQLATAGTVFNLDLVFYTEMLIRSNLNQLLNTYNQNYRVYS